MRLTRKHILLVATMIGLGIWLAAFAGEIRKCVSGPSRLVYSEQLTPGAYLDLGGAARHTFPIYAWNTGTVEHARYYAVELPIGGMVPAILPVNGGRSVVGVIEPLSRRDREQLMPAMRERFPDEPILPLRLNGLRPVPSLAFWMTLPMVVWISCLAVVCLSARASPTAMSGAVGFVRRGG